MLKETVHNIVSKTGRTETEARAELAARNPQKRMVQPEEVANAVLWLCLPGSEAVTGQAIAVAGGEVM
jgi:NAD(P)-dependent dehydrogenase (short-subunit alcohol dehydrogenase family)